MRIIITSLLTFFIGITSAFGQIFINELSYKNVNASDRGVEIAGPANTDLDNWRLDCINNLGTVYHTETINGTLLIDDEASSRGGIWLPVAGLQQQDDRTIILYDASNNPIDTISYGSNPFVDYASKNIGIIQDLIGNPGETPQNPFENNNDGNWNLEPETKGNLNSTQVPVELMSFEAFVLENKVTLTWQTATEINNSHFEIERSIDGVEYEKIGQIEGNGSTLETQLYEFTDDIPAKGRNYYRLKQVDFDGQFEYSDVIIIDYNKEVSVIIAPNPITQNGRLNIQMEQLDQVDFILYDMTGKVIKVYHVIDRNGIQLHDLSSGMYIYQIRQQQRIIKTDKLVVID